MITKDDPIKATILTMDVISDAGNKYHLVMNDNLDVLIFTGYASPTLVIRQFYNLGNAKGY